MQGSSSSVAAASTRSRGTTPAPPGGDQDAAAATRGQALLSLNNASSKRRVVSLGSYNAAAGGSAGGWAAVGGGKAAPMPMEQLSQLVGNLGVGKVKQMSSLGHTMSLAQMADEGLSLAGAGAAAALWMPSSAQCICVSLAGLEACRGGLFAPGPPLLLLLLLLLLLSVAAAAASGAPQCKARQQALSPALLLPPTALLQASPAPGRATSWPSSRQWPSSSWM